MKKSITTRSGDRGNTCLFSGEGVSKDSPRMHACGTLDELVSFLGLAKASILHVGRDGKKEGWCELNNSNESLDQDEKERWMYVAVELQKIQKALFTLGAEIATSPKYVDGIKERVSESWVHEMDIKLARIEEEISMPKGFILPGLTLAGAHLDICRTTARRLERLIVGLTQDGTLENPQMVIWVNRLSDYLWLLARYIEGDSTPL